MNLNQWAIKYGIPLAAVVELRQIMGAVNTDVSNSNEEYSEGAVQSLVRLEASRKGARLFRNNVGAFTPPEGGLVRYGLANDTKEMNQNVKSSDLIGIKPIIVTPEMVGYIVGVFLAREIKESGWTYCGNKKEEAQLKFIELITSLGGDACFASSEGTII